MDEGVVTVVARTGKLSFFLVGSLHITDISEFWNLSSNISGFL
jgi:hypothetical protein